MASIAVQNNNKMEFNTSNDNSAWNEFLEKEKNNQMITIAHNPSIGPILSKTFGYQSQNRMMVKGDKIVGVFPTVMFRDRVVSIPHFSYGGPIMDSNEVIDVDLKTLLDGKKFEIRSFSKLSDYVYDKKISCVLNVHESVDAQMMSLKSKLRQKIRKAEKLGYTIKIGGQELLDDYYGMYSRKMLEFGSPPIGKVFFKNLLTDYEFGEVEIAVLYDGDKVIASGMALSYLNFNEVCWSSTDSSYNRFNIHALFCWEMLKSSVEKKHTYFSFGRSTIDSNNHRFKKQWNPLELPIYYSYSEPLGKSIKELSYLTKIWKLQPLSTSVYFGHKISKYVY